MIDAPAAEIWSMVRFDEVPFHHLLSGAVASAKRASGSGKEVAGIADLIPLPLELKQSVCLFERQLVVAAARHLLVAVVAVLVHVPDRQPLIGQRRVAAGPAAVLDEEVLATAA